MIPLGQQPLFQLLGALIVLLVTDWRPGWGILAGLVWIAWIAASASASAGANRSKPWI